MLSNEDADNSNEKEIDNLNAIVNEKMISLDLATTQHLFRLACNYANGSKKDFSFVQDLNHIISVKPQIMNRKGIQVELNFPSFATEGPATSVLRGIRAYRGCSKIKYTNCKT